MTLKYRFVADYAREVTNSDSDYQKTIFNAQSGHPNVNWSNVQEVSASLERELAPNVAARLLHVLKDIGSDYSTVNGLRSSGAYDIPITRRDPGPDGSLDTADDGGVVTINDYDAAYRGSTFVGNQPVNRPAGRNDYYNSSEGSITRRLANSWSLLTAFTATKWHRWLVGVPQRPNDNYFPLDNSWRWNFKLNGHYNLRTMFSSARPSRPSAAPSDSERTSFVQRIPADPHSSSWQASRFGSSPLGLSTNRFRPNSICGLARKSGSGEMR